MTLHWEIKAFQLVGTPKEFFRVRKYVACARKRFDCPLAPSDRRIDALPFPLVFLEDVVVDRVTLRLVNLGRVGSR